MNGTAVSGAAGATIRERRRFRARFVVGYALSYVTDTVLLFQFVAIGTIPIWVPNAYFAAGITIGAVFSALVLFGIRESGKDPYFSIWQVFVSGAVMLVFLALAPEVGGLFLCNLILVFGFGGLRMSWREALLSFGLIALATGLILYHVFEVSLLPYSTPFERTLVWIGFVLILGKVVALGLVGSSLRLRAVKAYRDSKALNATLEARTSELIDAEQHLRASIRGKELLLREVHHAVKNNLQIVASILELGAESATNETVASTLNASRDRVLAIGLVHEKVYGEEDLAAVDVRRYLESLTENLKRSLQRASDTVVLQTDLEQMTLGADRVVLLGLIINELVTNAFKHAFPEERSGTILLSLQRRDDGMVELIVEDNGVGLPPGVGWRNPRTVGLDLVNGLAKQLDAEISLDDREGTRYCVRFRET